MPALNLVPSSLVVLFDMFCLFLLLQVLHLHLVHLVLFALPGLGVNLLALGDVGHGGWIFGGILFLILQKTLYDFLVNLELAGVEKLVKVLN